MPWDVGFGRALFACRIFGVLHAGRADQYAPGGCGPDIRAANHLFLGRKRVGAHAAGRWFAGAAGLRAALCAGSLGRAAQMAVIFP